MSSINKFAHLNITCWQFFRMVFVLFSLFLMGDAFYRWDGFKFYGSFSEFLPSVALASILWSLVAVVVSTAVWLSFLSIEWFSNRIGRKIEIEHLLLYTGIFIILGASVWRGKKIVWPDATSKVTVEGGSSETISFSVAPGTAGEYKISIGDLLGTFRVRAPAPPSAPVVAPAPASFAIADLLVTPSEVDLAEQVTISAVLTNTGGSEGSYTVVLKIDGTEEAIKEVTLAAGQSEAITFTIAKETEGSYAVDIDGKVGQFTVIVPPPPTPAPVEALPVEPPTNWGLIGGIIAGCVVVAAGLLVYFFVWRKRGVLRRP